MQEGVEEHVVPPIVSPAMAKRKRLRLNEDALKDLDAGSKTTADDEIVKADVLESAVKFLKHHALPTRENGTPLTKSILTPKLIDDFCTLIGEGHPADTVSNYLGIMPCTYWEWMHRGSSYLNNGGGKEEHYLFAVFVSFYRRALANYLMGVNRRLHSEDNERWFRDMEILSRRDRKTWSRDEPAGGDESQFNPDERFL
jgi:hypothetical protein